MRRTHSARGTDTDTNPAANTAITTTTVTTATTDTFTAADATKLVLISLVHWLFGAEPALVHARPCPSGRQPVVLAFLA